MGPAMATLERRQSSIRRPPHSRHPAPPRRRAAMHDHELSDQRLLSDHRRGDERSFLILVTRYRGELVGFLTKLLGDYTAAEDVAQETFLRVHRSAHQFENHRDLRPWLFSIAANAAKDMYRWNVRRPALSLHAGHAAGDDWWGAEIAQANAERPGDRLERHELSERVRGVVERMPTHLREILSLAYFSQTPYRQISEVLGIPLGTVKSRLHAAVAHFARRWDQLG